MNRAERRIFNRLVAALGDCPLQLAARLRRPRWWERAHVVRAFACSSPFGAVQVFRHFPTTTEPRVVTQQVPVR